MCHVSGVKCNFFVFFLQSGWVSWWLIGYQRGSNLTYWVNPSKRGGNEAKQGLPMLVLGWVTAWCKYPMCRSFPAGSIGLEL